MTEPTGTAAPQPTPPTTTPAPTPFQGLGVGSEGRLTALALLLAPAFAVRKVTDADLRAAAMLIENAMAWAVHGELPPEPEPPTAAASPHALATVPTGPVNTMVARNPHSISLEAPLSPAATTTAPNLHPFPSAAPTMQPGVTATMGTPVANTTGK